MTADPDRLPPPSAVLPDTGRSGFIDRLRAEDPAFAEASVPYEDDMGEWQSAVYLLTGCEPIWRALGSAVVAERSMVPVLDEVENPRRAWSGSEDEVMTWAAHFWDLRRHPASFPATFQGFLFDRWITALHLRGGHAPRRHLTGSRRA